MIQSKKIKLFLTAIIISVVMTLLPVQTEAKDKIYLNRTKITLNVGQTKKLSLIRNKKNVKKKIKWVSENRKKVSVDRKGVVRALCSGKAKITAKYQGKKYICIVVVKNRRQSEAAAPTSSPASLQTSRSITFRNESLLREHFDKHGKEMGFTDAKAYEQAAAAVVTNPLSLHKLEAEDKDDVYYLESTNEFVIVSTDGYIRTYFKPDKGKAYFDQQ
ncbi:MAG: Ig-like domain-containing protein [Eubacterium sp.]